MPRDWEAWLQTAARPASTTEEAERDRTESRIRDAIAASGEFSPGQVRVYTKGSYANNTNVRRDADVDVAVEWQSFFYVDTWGETAGMSPEQLGYTPVQGDITPAEFRTRLERALRTGLDGRLIDASGDKAVKVAASPTTLDADVVPCFILRRYDRPRVPVIGHRIYARNGEIADNFPQQHYDNGVAKNTRTSRRYKQIVRCLKRIEAEMVADGAMPQPYPGYLIECMTYNVPDARFAQPTLLAATLEVLEFLTGSLQQADTYENWVEVNDLRWLFRNQTATRSIPEALSFTAKAWLQVLS